MILRNLENLSYLTPELILMITILVSIFLGLRRKASLLRSIPFVVNIGLICTFGAMIILISRSDSGGAGLHLFNGLISFDPFSLYFKAITLLATLLVVLMGYKNKEVAPKDYPEFHALLVSIVLGVFVLASANNLLVMYISFEFISMMSYVLTGFKRQDKAAVEASLKYLIYGAFASGCMLYGLSFIYGIFGGLNFCDIQNGLANLSSGFTVMLTAAIILMTVGFGFKIAAVPFHMWCPDVYQGAPTHFTAFLSVVPKAAGFAILIRFFYSTFIAASSWNHSLSVISDVPWVLILGVLAIVTMTVGNLTAIFQRNIKRLLAYSSISHAGYMLMGVMVVSIEGLKAVLFYLLVYAIMNIGAFLVVLTIANTLNTEEIDGYRGLGYRSPFMALMFCIFLFSLTGIPPFGGFIGKLYLFAPLIEKGGSLNIAVVLVAILNSVISLFYYARIVKTMFLERPVSKTPVIIDPYYKSLAAILAALVLGLGIYWGFVATLARNSVRIMGLF